MGLVTILERVTLLTAFERGRPGAKERVPADLESSLASRLTESCLALGLEDLSSEVRDRFTERWAKLAPEEGELLDWIAGFHLRDFLLAFLAAEGDPRALQALDQEFIRPAARRSSMGEPPDEVAAATLSHLLVPHGDREVRILSYSGRGPLYAWVHMVAKRKAGELARKVIRGTNDAAQLLDNSPLLVDPELDLMKFRYAEKFNEALEQALRELPAREANLLYLTAVKRVALASAARMEQVSMRTVQRRIVAIRQKVFEQTRAIARAKLDASEEEMSSLFALVQSQLDVTLHRVLAPSNP